MTVRSMMMIAIGSLSLLAACHSEPDPKVPLEAIAMSSDGAAELPAGVAAGRSPRLAPGQPLAIWIGRKDSGEWSLRTTTMKASHRFQGRVRPTSGKLTTFKPTRMDNNDRFKFDGNDVVFDITTQTDEDGFDFTANKCVEFDLRIDGQKQPHNIIIGEKEYKTTSSHFILCP